MKGGEGPKIDREKPEKFDEVAMWGNKIPQEEPKSLFRIAFYITENWRKFYEKKKQKQKSVRNDISMNVHILKICKSEKAGIEQNKFWPLRSLSFNGRRGP